MAPIFVPLVIPEGMVGPMFGGNYVINEHSEGFPKYPNMDRVVPIPVHDRFETEEQYKALSN